MAQLKLLTGTRVRRSGVSLVEVLTVVAILALAFGLVLPAINYSREAARKLQCQNRLKQIGLALLVHHDTHRHFPPGFTPAPVDGNNRWTRGYACYGWAAHLLPYMEQAGLHDTLEITYRDLEERLEDRDAKSVMSRPLATFKCPSDLAGETFETAPIWGGNRPLNRAVNTPTSRPVYGATSSYVANCGYYEPLQPFSPDVGTTWPEYERTSGPSNGPFFAGSRTTLASITDGSSHTIAVGERAFFQGSAMWIGSGNILGVFEGGPGVCLGRVYWRVNELPDPPGIRITPSSRAVISGQTTAREGFSSYHRGGANFLFADGAVKFVSELIESRNTTASKAAPTPRVPDSDLLGTFQRLGIMNDGKALPKP